MVILNYFLLFFASERVPIFECKTKRNYFIAVYPLHHSMGDPRNCIEWNVTKIHSTTYEREIEIERES